MTPESLASITRAMGKLLLHLGERARRMTRHAWNIDVRRGAGWLRSYAASVTDLVYPPTCLLCGRETPVNTARFCQHCHRELTVSSVPSCLRCARPLPSSAMMNEDGCAKCHDKRWRFHRTIALGTYGGLVRDLVLGMKKARNESLTLAAGTLLAERVGERFNGALPDVVTSVPMHWFRRLVRGVNGSELLAESVALRLGSSRQAALVHCRRSTKKQGTLWPTERLRNVRGAYAVTARQRRQIDGAHVLVVDDVMTTGATANEMARVLRREGAREVSIAVIARGVGFD